jgi:hypothetical protein
MPATYTIIFGWQPKIAQCLKLKKKNVVHPHNFRDSFSIIFTADFLPACLTKKTRKS